MQCDWRFAEVKKLGSFLATSTTYVSFQRKGVLLAEEPPFCHSDAYHKLCQVGVAKTVQFAQRFVLEGATIEATDCV